MPRGRPTQSTIRQGLIEILAVKVKTYGYALHKYYVQIYGPCTREVVYYHLKKGMDLGEFQIGEIKREEGTFSWGGVVEKKYYVLGPNAKPRGNPQVKAFFEKEASAEQPAASEQPTEPKTE